MNEYEKTAVDEAAELDAEGHDRTLPPFLIVTMGLLAAGYSLFHLVVLNFWSIDEWVYRVLHVNFGAVM